MFTEPYQLLETPVFSLKIGAVVDVFGQKYIIKKIEDQPWDCVRLTLHPTIDMPRVHDRELTTAFHMYVTLSKNIFVNTVLTS